MSEREGWECADVWDSLQRYVDSDDDVDPSLAEEAIEVGRALERQLAALRSENEQWAARVLDMQTQNEALRAELAGLRTGHESLYKEAKGRAVENLELWHKYKGMEGQFANANRLCMERGKELAALKAERDALKRYRDGWKVAAKMLSETIREHRAEWEAICNENHRADKLEAERDALKAQLTVKPIVEHRAEQLDWRHAAEVQAQESDRLRAALEQIAEGAGYAAGEEPVEVRIARAALPVSHSDQSAPDVQNGKRCVEGKET